MAGQTLEGTSTGKRPTIDDVARLSGVGRATVSRVLNDGPNVSDKMRSRVLEAVETLGYQVNLQARFLAGGANRTVLLIFSSDTESEPNSYYQAALETGALRVCAQTGFELVTHSVVQSGADVETRILHLVEESRCRGVILTPPFSDWSNLVRLLTEAGTALVRISPGSSEDPGAPGVGMDDEAAGFALARHLLDLGHRRVGFIQGLAEHLSAERRFLGAMRAFKEEGLDENAIVSRRGNFTFKSGTDLLPELIATDPRPTAIICANDDTAVGALFAAHRDGLDVPRDLSIASFDDTPVSALVWPPLTTVHQPIQEMSARAMQIIAGAGGSGGVAPQSCELLPFTIVERASVASPARR
ncbi:LacI family DNA-binding transcriptional regulator [Sphingomonas xinjiangensis]|uniref:LacI family transcriptional regulator n=1 Tax=Sphingomonas xinjiangensis TaxID=643568 RepID=A0A840YR66_9SPHN|nr:LacI family DNA-binding transcriptional regulator [Sphingomonas xinjiangensis]MBB5711782.1 LacI family transcriptional regulator [Sphingomonas xinjiangensis]